MIGVMLAAMIAMVSGASWSAEAAKDWPFPSPEDSACEHVLLSTETWRYPRQPTDFERELFRQCAFENTNGHMGLTLAYLRERFKPYQLPRALADEIARMFEMTETDPRATFRTALEYFDDGYPERVEGAAEYWLSRISQSKNPCQLPAMHKLGLFALRQPDRKFRFGINPESLLRRAAHLYYPPAMKDFGEYLLRRDVDQALWEWGYAFLLGAKQRGEDVQNSLDWHGRALGEQRRKSAADLAMSIFRNAGPSPRIRC